MPLKKFYFIPFALAVVLTACHAESPKKNEIENVIRIKGSNTEYKMVEELALAFGKRRHCNFEMDGEGTSTGIEALIQGKADIANSSRMITAHEIQEAESCGIRLVPVVVAVDAIAFISNPHNRVDSLSTIQIKGILSGEIDNWKQVGGLDRKIVLCGRNEKSGTYKFLEDKFVKDSGFAPATKKLPGNQEIVDAVIRDTFAIGYVGAGFIMDSKGKPNSKIWAVYIYTEGENEAYSPYQTMAVIRGDYPLVRPLYQYFNGIPKGNLLDFLKFELSEEGQAIIRANGFFPLTSQMERENYLHGVVF